VGGTLLTSVVGGGLVAGGVRAGLSRFGFFSGRAAATNIISGAVGGATAAGVIDASIELRSDQPFSMSQFAVNTGIGFATGGLITGIASQFYSEVGNAQAARGNVMIGSGINTLAGW